VLAGVDLSPLKAGRGIAVKVVLHEVVPLLPFSTILGSTAVRLKSCSEITSNLSLAEGGSNYEVILEQLLSLAGGTQIPAAHSVWGFV